MSDIVSNFKDILTNYKVIDNQVVLEDSDIVSRIENEYKANLEEFIKEITGSDDYIVSFEASKNGNLLRIPAATFFNKNFTDSHNDGLFLGFSFYPAKGLVYFKLDQELVVLMVILIYFLLELRNWDVIILMRYLLNLILIKRSVELEMCLVKIIV